MDREPKNIHNIHEQQEPLSNTGEAFKLVRIIHEADSGVHVTHSAVYPTERIDNDTVVILAQAQPKVDPDLSATIAIGVVCGDGPIQPDVEVFFDPTSKKLIKYDHLDSQANEMLSGEFRNDDMFIKEKELIKYLKSVKDQLDNKWPQDIELPPLDEYEDFSMPSDASVGLFMDTASKLAQPQTTIDTDKMPPSYTRELESSWSLTNNNYHVKVITQIDGSGKAVAIKVQKDTPILTANDLRYFESYRIVFPGNNGPAMHEDTIYIDPKSLKSLNDNTLKEAVALIESAKRMRGISPPTFATSNQIEDTLALLKAQADAVHGKD